MHIVPLYITIDVIAVWMLARQMEVRRYDPRWTTPLNILLAGPSQSGKTQYVSKLIKHFPWLLDRPMQKIVFCYAVWQPAYDEMKRQYTNINFHEGLPDSPFELFSSQDRPGLMIFDDLMGELTDKENKKKIEQWFTRGSHHHDVSLCVLIQNLFPKDMRTVSLNAHIIIYFTNPRDQLQLRTLARQAFPSQGDRIKRAYLAIKDTPYHPLILDFQQKTPDEFRVRTGLLPEELKSRHEPFSKLYVS